MDPKAIFDVPSFDPHAIEPVIMQSVSGLEFYRAIVETLDWETTLEGAAYVTNITPSFVKDNGFCTSTTGFNSGFYIFTTEPEKMYLFLKLGGTNDLRVLVDIADPDFTTDLICIDPDGNWVRCTWNKDIPIAIDRFTFLKELEQLAERSRMTRCVRASVQTNTGYRATLKFPSLHGMTQDAS